MSDVETFLAEWRSPSPLLLVHTSGSTGKPKALWVEKSRMRASARLTCDALGLRSGDTALLCMPLGYIAGKMMVARAEERGLRLISVTPSNHPLADVAEHIDFAAMVPSQVWCSLQEPLERERLRAIGTLIIGGGAVSRQLEHALRTFPGAVFSTYGMTETLSHIALRRLSGAAASKWYEPMPGVSVATDAECRLVIDAPAVCALRLVTNDIAEIDGDGRHFRIIGRRDNVIVCGGVKLHIEEIEERLRQALTSPFCVTKRADEKFGEVPVLLTTAPVPPGAFRFLTPYSRPKAVVEVAAIPQTATGKTDRAAARRLAERCAASLG